MFTPKRMKIYGVYTVSILLIYWFTPLNRPLITTVITLLAMVMVVHAILVGFRSPQVRKNKWNWLYLFALLAFVVLGTAAKLRVERYWYMFPIVTSLFLIMAQSVNLTKRYVDAGNEVEHLNENLESLVMQRTSELKKTNELLSVSQSSLKEMISHISHDLKTPVTALNNYLELLSEGEAFISQEDNDKYIAAAYSKNLDLQRLIGNLFEITRIDSGQITYQKMPVSVKSIFKNAAIKYSDLANQKGIQLIIQYPKADFNIHVDKDKIWSVLDNVVYNAISYIPENSEIVLSAKLDKDKGSITVSDNGNGVPAQQLPFLFDKFYKVSKARDTRDSGSGIGLYIVKTVMEAMEGKAEAYINDNGGLSIKLTFPINQAD